MSETLSTLADLIAVKQQQFPPEIVYLCGDMETSRDMFRRANLQQTLQGRIVLSRAEALTDQGTLPAWKIDLCSAVLVLNVDGIITAPMMREIIYAHGLKKPVSYSVPDCIFPSTFLRLHDWIARKEQQLYPEVVCLCGSTTRAKEAFREVYEQESAQGHIVLSIGCDTKSDSELAQQDGFVIDKQLLDTLHLWKIDLAHRVKILNVGGYLGESTWREYFYAQSQHKPIDLLEPLTSLD